MITTTDVRVFTVRCFYCGGGEFDHRRDNGACHAFQRAEVKPVVYRARPQKAAAGWVVR